MTEKENITFTIALCVFNTLSGFCGTQSCSLLIF